MTSPFTPTFKRPQQLRVQHLNDLLPSAKVLSFLNLYPSLNRWFVSVRIVIFSIAYVRLCPRILQLRAFIHARSLYHSFLRAARSPFLRAAHSCAQPFRRAANYCAEPVSHSFAPRAAHFCAQPVSHVTACHAQQIPARSL